MWMRLYYAFNVQSLFPTRALPAAIVHGRLPVVLSLACQLPTSFEMEIYGSSARRTGSSDRPEEAGGCGIFYRYMDNCLTNGLILVLIVTKDDAITSSPAMSALPHVHSQRPPTDMGARMALGNLLLLASAPTSSDQCS